MYVPYLDPNSTQYRKNFFDWGEYGAGPLTNSLELGCDCLGVIHYFDAAVLGGDGSARVIPSASSTPAAASAHTRTRGPSRSAMSR